MRNIELTSKAKDKMASDDRVLVLKAKEEGKGPKGLVDNTLLTGGNKLHAIFEGHTCLWYLKYENGALPEPLRDKRFTSFKKAKEAAEIYFNKRNLQITKVED